eukprot:GEMP01071104.1.p3 GENE.GEMP01071104.1~~GEMP01071104.1.p3  ORF type:complete len:180 (+),score=58.43 GEMP01071104.1:52-591(+)
MPKMGKSIGENQDKVVKAKQGARDKGASHKTWTPEEHEILKALVERGESARSIAKANAHRGWSTSSVIRKVAALKKGGGLERKEGQGRPFKHNHDAAAAAMSEAIQCGKGASLRNLARKRKMSKSTAARVVRVKLGYKSARKVQSKRMSEKTRLKRVERARELKAAIDKKNGIDLKKVW